MADSDTVHSGRNRFEVKQKHILICVKSYIQISVPPLTLLLSLFQIKTDVLIALYTALTSIATIVFLIRQTSALILCL